eukprot:3032479-Prymnesium_polylepis.1
MCELCRNYASLCSIALHARLPVYHDHDCVRVSTHVPCAHATADTCTRSAEVTTQLVTRDSAVLVGAEGGNGRAA